MKSSILPRRLVKRDRTLIEPLEARIAPAANNWVGASSGNWNNPANWSDGVPTADDVVTIDPPGTLTITIDGGGQVAASIAMTGDDLLSITGGSLTLTGASTLHSLTLTGGGMLFAIADTSLTGSGVLGGNATLGGSAKIINYGTLTINDSEPNLATELVNAGTISQGNAYFDMDGPAAKVRVVSGGVYETVNTGSGYSLRGLNNPAGMFVEADGVFRHASPNGAGFNVDSTAPFTVQGGTIQNIGASNSALNLNGIGTFLNATLVAAADTSINFGGDNNIIVGPMTGSGAGTIYLSGNAHLHADATGATLNFPAGLFKMGGNGTLSGPGVFTNTGAITISDNEPNLATELVNAGTISQGNAYFDMDGPAAKVRVVSGGMYETVNTGSGYALRGLNSPAGMFIEAGGVFRHASSSGASFFVDGTALFTVQGGTVQNIGVSNSALNLNGIGTFLNATLIAGANTSINFGGNTNTIAGTITGSGAGTVFFGSGQLHADATGTTLNFPAGLFDIGGNGTLSGPGVFTNTGAITISDNEPNLATELINAGTISQGNAYFDMDGPAAKVRVVSGGVYETVNTGSGYALRGLNNPAGMFIEAGGVFRHASSTGASFNIDATAPFTVQGGTVQNVGTPNSPLNLNGIGTFTNATLIAAAGTSINFGGNTNTIVGTIGGSGTGTVFFGSGQLHADATGATLNFPAGLFNIGGNGTLSGPGAFTNTGNITISDNEPNLATELVNAGTIRQGNAYFDMDGVKAKLRVISGGVYETVNTGSGYALRGLNSPAGMFIEAGGVFRHASSSGASYNIDGTAPFTVQGGTVHDSGVPGSALNLNGIGTFLNATLIAAAGTSINFGGNTNTLSGTIGGSGAGTIFLGSGQLHADATGTTLNFPAGLFNIGGNGTLSGPGVFINTGAITISDNEPNLATELINAGTISQGNAYFDMDGPAAKVRVVSGGVYETVNTGSGYALRGLNNPAGMFIEAGGVFHHASSSGAIFNVESTAPFSNLGTVNVSNGTLSIAGSIAQYTVVSGKSTLTAGTWEVANGTTLSLGTASFVNNAAKISVHGSGNFAGLSTLTTNSGSLNLLDGVDLTLDGSLTNSGALTLSPGTVLTVPDNFTQTSAGITTFQIGGTTPAQLGRLVVTGGVTLAGTANLQLANNFAPAAGLSLTLATYASKTGDFAKFTGLDLGRAALFEAFAAPMALTLSSLVDAADLATQTVSTPANTNAGQNIALSYTVKNVATNATLATSWTDAVYLSLDDQLDGTDILLTRVTHNGVVGPGGTYTENVNIPLVGALPEDYHILVFADGQGRVPDPDRVNNSLASTGTFALDIPALTLNTGFNGTIKSGQDLYYKVVVPSGATPSFTLSSAVAGEAEIYESYGAVPTRGAYDATAFALGSTTQRILADASATGTYYVLVHGREAAGAGQNFTLTANGLGFDLVGLDLSHGGNVGKITTTILGAQFTPGTTFSLKLGGTTRTASAVYFSDAKTVSATFDLTGLAAGNYDVVASDGAATDTLAGAFTVTNGGTPGKLVFHIETPRYIRPPFNGTAVTISYDNIGGADLDAPIFNLFFNNAQVRLADQVGFLNANYTAKGNKVIGNYELMGVSGGLAGTLSPGEHGEITVIFQPFDSSAHALVNFTADLAVPNSTPVDWDLLKDDLQPNGMPADAWNAVFTNFKASIGNSMKTYQAALTADANYLGQFGAVSPDVSRLVSFELQKADDFGAISENYQTGEFGRGHTSPFNERATVDEFGNVALVDGSLVRSFVKQENGIYRGVDGDIATLTQSATGVFTLNDGTGTKTVFRASDGHIDYIEDANHHRFTVAWAAGGLLQSVADSNNGDMRTYTHDAQGHIATETDAVGRVTTYGYDASGEHLTSVTTAQGTTTYTYTATGHALASTTGPDGVTTTYTYDTLGRLASETTGNGGNAVVLTVGHPGGGTVTVTDSAGHVSETDYGLTGKVARTLDAQGRVNSFQVDSLGRIVGAIGSDGVTSRLGYDANGNVSTAFTGSRATTHFEYSGDFQRLLSMTDPGGDTTKFSYDANGNLISTLLPDGFTKTSEYDAQGRLVAATNANGERVTFIYNAAGLVSQETLPGGDIVMFTYDAHRNLRTATDAGGTTTFDFDTADRMTSVSYPNGKAVTMTYDSSGRRETISDGTYTVKNSYDALGRLDVVRDGSDALLVDYDYNALGQLATETRGNGATTAYTYDASGRTHTITHKDATNAVTESFAYTYDLAGRVATVTTTAGTTTYGYDAAGQLTSTTLPGGRALAFAYDAEGNRVTVSDTANGTSNYTTNNGDQYTTVGGETLGYDREGRLVSRTAGGITTSYAYDSGGHLVSVISPGSVTTYDYDALGNRIAAVENGVRTDYANDPAGFGTVFGEYSSTATAHYASGLGVAARIGAGDTEYYHYDSTGNTALLSGTGGAAVATYSYLPFGQVAAQTGSISQPFTFDGRDGVRDEAGDLFDARARTYDASLGRFTSRDPIGLSGGDTNVYRYANNDPVNHKDPGGRFLTDTYEIIEGLEQFGPILTSSIEDGVLPYVGEALTLPVEALPLPGISPHVQGLIEASEAIGAEALLPLTVTAIGGGAVGTLFDQVSDYVAPKLKQDFRDNLQAGIDPVHPPTQELGLHDKDYGRYVQKVGKNFGINYWYKFYVKAGYSPEDALEKARVFQKKWDNDEERLKHPVPTDSGDGEVIRPGDPNNIVGPTGSGAGPVPDVIAPGQVRFDGFVGQTDGYAYRIEFENRPDASAPAQVVHVTQILDADLDLSTFSFVNFGFGGERVSATGSGTSFHTMYDGAVGTLGVRVQIDAELNTLTRVLDITFTSLDPATNDVPANPLAGFLPPDDATGRGDAFVNYSVKPKASLANGTEFTSIATIVFDTEAPLNTPTVTNKLDNVAPTSQIVPFASTISTRTSFAVHWTGQDDLGGSGLAGISLYYTDNGGSLLTASVVNADGGFRFDGEVGHTYAFYSAASDNVGNIEALKAMPDSMITVVAPTLITAPGNKVTLTDADGDSYTVKLTGHGTLQYATIDLDGAGPLNGSLDFLVLNGTTAKDSLTVTVKRKGDGPDADRQPDGDGIVTIGDVVVNGALKSFTAKTSDLNVNGLTASGVVKNLAVRDLLQPDVFAADPLIKTSGTTTDFLNIAARNLGDGFRIVTTGTLGAISAKTIGDGWISAAALKGIKTTAGAMDADLQITGAVGAISVKGGVAADTWSAASFGAIKVGGAFTPDITATGTVASIAARGDVSGDLEARNFGAISVVGGSLTGSLTSTTDPATLGKTAALTKLTVTGGNFSGSIDVLGNVGPLKSTASRAGGGDFSGSVTARSLGAVTVQGGDFSGNITATGSSAELGRQPGLAKLTVSGGDLTGNVRVKGQLGAVTIGTDRTHQHGSANGASVTAAKIASITVGGGLSDSLFIAGADLGADFALGGTGDDSDTYAGGSIGAVKIAGNVVASVIGAGLASSNSVFKDSDDTILGGTTSAIAKLIVKGTADSASYFAAGRFIFKPRIHNVTISDVSADGRFKIG